MNDKPFWRTKTLNQLTRSEWESLCDGCGQCCLHKLQDEDTDEIYWTSVACTLLNAETCQCRDYPNRKKTVPDCVFLTPEIVDEVDWLPVTCAYRLVAEGSTFTGGTRLFPVRPKPCMKQAFPFAAR